MPPLFKLFEELKSFSSQGFQSFTIRKCVISGVAKLSWETGLTKIFFLSKLVEK